MPLPKPKIGETKETFLERCLTQIAGEFPDEKQRLAVCNAQW
jgi:hypothetical protein